MQDDNNQNNSDHEDESRQNEMEADFVLEPMEGEAKKKNVQNTGDEEFVAEDGEGNTGSSNDTIQSLREKLKKAVAEKQEYLDGWQRTRADFTNARKREEESRKEIVKFANEDLISQMLPVLDSFTMAFANKEAWEKVDKNWRIGVEYIYSQLLSTLTQNGFSEFDPKGQKFDPVQHVAIETIEVTDKTQDHMILETTQKGYILNGKIVRPASVKIGEVKE